MFTLSYFDHRLSLSSVGCAQWCLWECEMIPEKPADRASDLIMMNQGLEKLSGHQPFLSGFILHSNSVNSLNKAAKHNREALSSTEAVATVCCRTPIVVVWTENGGWGTIECFKCHKENRIRSFCSFFNRLIRHFGTYACLLSCLELYEKIVATLMCVQIQPAVS